jgi:multimeric flavodoxin WrbA
MKKVTAFVASGARRNTYRAVVQFQKNLQLWGDVDFEIVMLSEYNLKFCRGCRLCFDKGEEFCPLKDDRDVLFAKIDASDGVIFATPNYNFQMSGLMKAFLDRFGFVFHRPRYMGKSFTSIVTQGVGGADKIIKELDFAANIMGFRTVMGTKVTGFDPKTEQQLRTAEKNLMELSKRFSTLLEKPADVVPTLYQLFIFRFGRTTIKQLATPDYIDYQYYASRGWLESDYYYPTRMSPPKKVAGMVMDSIMATFRKAMA